MEIKLEEPRQVCHDKGFNVAKKKKKFSQRQGVKKILLQHGKRMSRHRVQSPQYKATQLCRDKEKICCDNKSMLLGETLSRHKIDNINRTMSRQSQIMS